MIYINIGIVIFIVIVISFGLGWAFWRFNKKIARLKSLAYSDDLGILNHSELNSCVNHLVKNPAVKSFIFVLINIDRFKNYNDTYGYDKADLILQEFVNTIKSFIRKPDMFFRYKNGDEFALIFNNTDIEEAKEIGNRLRRVVANHPFEIDNQLVNLTISMGITSSFKKDSPSKIRKRAEIALHEAKHSKNTVVLMEDSQVLDT